jgi:hypothetical protein
LHHCPAGFAVQTAGSVNHCFREVEIMASSRAKLITSWVLSALPSLMMLGPSAYFKLNPSTEMVEDFAKIGLTTQQVFVIGVVEIVIVLLYLFPRTSFLGAILVTGYLGGATFVMFAAGSLHWPSHLRNPVLGRPGTSPSGNLPFGTW